MVPAVVLKVHLGHTIDQSIEQEVPMLPASLLGKLRLNYAAETGDEVDRQSSPSDAQLTALYFKAFHGLPPYVDFGVWGRVPPGRSGGIGSSDG